MHPLARLLLCCLLALALPLQAWAALHGGHGAHPAMAHVVMAASDAEPPCHESAALKQETNASDEASAACACGHCGSCCLLVALPPALPVLPEPRAADSELAAVPGTPTSLSPPPLFKPPRA